MIVKRILNSNCNLLNFFVLRVQVEAPGSETLAES